MPDGSLSEVRLIPKDGAVSLLRNDPKSRGPRLFAQHCASCHTYDDGSSLASVQGESQAKSTAPNLFGFASRGWLKSLISVNGWSGPNYFGNTAHKAGRMATWLQQHSETLQPADIEAIAAALSAQAQLKSQSAADKNDVDLISRGLGLIEQNCARGCHRFGDLSLIHI